MLDEANSKRRKLDREKRSIDRPQDGQSSHRSAPHPSLCSLHRNSHSASIMLTFFQTDTLTSLLAPRPLPIVPLEYTRRLGFEGETLMEPEILWALQVEDLRTNAKVSALAGEEAWSDMERMGVRFPALLLSSQLDSLSLVCCALDLYTDECRCLHSSAKHLVRNPWNRLDPSSLPEAPILVPPS